MYIPCIPAVSEDCERDKVFVEVVIGTNFDDFPQLKDELSIFENTLRLL